MYQNIGLLLSKFESKRLNNPSILLLLCVFNAALVMNFKEMMFKLPITAIVLLLTCIGLVNHKLWWTTAINVLIRFCVLLIEFPRLANHCNLETFICLILLVGFFIKIIKPKFKIDSGLISQIFKITLISIYFYTGFHKINTAFLDSNVSCVNWANTQIIENFVGFKDNISNSYSVFFQYSTLFLEMVLPLGLLSNKTRKWTAILLLSFHFYLAFHMFSAFSAFVSFMILGSLLDFKATHLSSKVVRAMKIYILFVLLSFLIRLFLFKVNFNPIQLRFINGIVYNIGFVYFFTVFFKNYKSQKYTYSKNHFIPILFCFLCVSFWTLKSYIGLGNAGNLTMFSNLVTEKSRSNHLLIDTKKTKIFNFEEDHLLIIKLHNTLKNKELEGFLLPVIEFKFQAKKWTEKFPNTKINATLVYKKDTIVISDLKNSEFVKTKWWYQYLFFRKIQVEGNNDCYW